MARGPDTHRRQSQRQYGLNDWEKGVILGDGALARGPGCQGCGSQDFGFGHAASEMPFRCRSG